MADQLNDSYRKWLLAICGVFVLTYIDSMWSLSVDLAHHYALIFRISEQWALMSSADPTLGEMNIYPRGAHILASLAGFIVGSSFLGMHIVALISVALIWFSVIIMFRTLRRNLAVLTLLIFSIFVIVNFYLLNFELHGREIVANYFFSQLVGCAVVFVGLHISVKFESKFGALPAIAILVVLMLLSAFIHILPAIEILGIIFFLLLTNAVCNLRSGQFLKKNIFVALVIFLPILFLLIFHPSFFVMKEISKNNGALSINNVQYPLGLLFVCAIVFFSSLLLLWHWFNGRNNADSVAIKYFSIYGLVVSVLCFLQYLLVALGYGSDYAVKKYSFGLLSILIIQLSIISSLYLIQFFDKYIDQILVCSVYIELCCLVMAITSILFFLLPDRKIVDVSDLVATERRLVGISDSFLPSVEDGVSNIVIGLDGFSNSLNYMFSIAITKTPRETAIPDVLVKGDLNDSRRYAYVVSSDRNQYFSPKICEDFFRGALSVVTAKCFEDSKLQIVACKSDFDFTSNGNLPHSSIRGFGHAEPVGRWSEEKVASFECLNDDRPPKFVKLQVTPFLFGELRSQRISVYLNGVLLGASDISESRVGDGSLKFNIPDSIGFGKYFFEFRFPDARSPKDVGFNEDTRVLGFSFKSISFE